MTSQTRLSRSYSTTSSIRRQGCRDDRVPLARARSVLDVWARRCGIGQRSGGATSPTDLAAARIVFLYGTNNLGQTYAPSGAPAETTAPFQVSRSEMVISLVRSNPVAKIA